MDCDFGRYGLTVGMFRGVFDGCFLTSFGCTCCFILFIDGLALRVGLVLAFTGLRVGWFTVCFNLVWIFFDSIG